MDEKRNTSTNISCFIGEDEHYKDLLTKVAELHNTTVGKLVRKALDATYGADMEIVKPIFFEMRRLRIDNSEHKSTHRRQSRQS